MNARRHRIDPWHELQLAAHAALRGGSPAAVKAAADRVKYVAPIGRDFVATFNALKALAYAWPHATPETQPHIEAAVQSTLAALELWPAEERIAYLAAVTLNTNSPQPRKAS